MVYETLFYKKGVKYTGVSGDIIYTPGAITYEANDNQAAKKIVKDFMKGEKMVKDDYFNIVTFADRVEVGV